MRRIIVAAFVSLDGIMQAPGGPEEDPSGGFKFGGWTVPYWDDAIGEVIGGSFSQPFALLLGRKTYDIFAAHWPHVSTDDPVNGPIATTFNAATKYVLTHRPESVHWQNSEGLGRDPVARLRDITTSDGPDLLVQGSTEVIQLLLANDLVDEFRLLIYPLVLGTGKRLFGDGTVPVAFAFKGSVTAPTGVISATYGRGGAITTGSFALENPTDEELQRRETLR